MRRVMRAFSLVEVLVALVLVSVSLLGLAQLAVAGLQESAGALARTQAVYLVADMAERIRANPDAGEAFDCATYPDGPRERGCSPSGVPASDCTARELAEEDLARWQASVRQALPFVPPGKCDANVTYLAAASGGEPVSYRVDVTWQQPGSKLPLTLSRDVRMARRRAM